MMRRRAPASDTIARALGIGSIIALMVAAVLYLEPELGTRATAPDYPEATPMAPPGDPIAAEALVFRTRPEDVAVAPNARPRRAAQPRTLAIYRSLRAYPGAPPRVPHGLTDDEFRATRCNTCHLRGGYVERFGGYAPVTPHPEYVACLQCHAADAMRVGIALPGDLTDQVCSQCHVNPGQPPPSLVSLDWVPRPWPGRAPRAMEGSPPVIPHDLQLRGNCMACHAGPGAVREIRTTHPERRNCRQCHVPAASEVGEFVRPGTQ